MLQNTSFAGKKHVRFMRSHQPNPNGFIHLRNRLSVDLLHETPGPKINREVMKEMNPLPCVSVSAMDTVTEAALHSQSPFKKGKKPSLCACASVLVCQLASVSARLQSDSVVMRGDVREEAAADELSLWIWPRSDQPPVTRLPGPTAHTLKDNTAGCRTDAHFYLFFGLFIKCVGKELPQRPLLLQARPIRERDTLQMNNME